MQNEHFASNKFKIPLFSRVGQSQCSLMIPDQGWDSQTYIIVNVIVREILKHTKVPNSVSVNLQNVCKTHTKCNLTVTFCMLTCIFCI